MILADDIAEACGTINDTAGFFTSLNTAIQKSERLVLTDDVAAAAYKLIRTKPSSMLAAMPICRLPFKSIWIEWSGGIADRAGWPLHPAMDRNQNNQTERVNPIRMGCLVEAIDDTYQRGQMTWAWLHPTAGMNGSPLAVTFDWTEDGDAESAARASATVSDFPLNESLFQRWVINPQNAPDHEMASLMVEHSGWETMKNNPAEILAVREMVRRQVVWISRHGHDMMNMLFSSRDPDYIAKIIRAWEGDICGEAGFIESFLMMLNSRNAVETTPHDITKLNRARAKRGKPQFREHSITTLYMSKHRRMIAASGDQIADARGTGVMGHFKIRKSGVWWWNEHYRGDRNNPMPRSHYEVKP